MMNSISHSQKIKLLSSLLSTFFLGMLLILLLVVYLNSSLGWFAVNEQIEGSGIGETVYAPSAEAEYTVYIYDAKLSKVRYTGDDDPASAPTIENMNMQIHDVIFKSRNRYTPAIVRIHLKNIAKEYIPQTNSANTVSVTLGRDTSLPIVDEHGALSEYSTSVLRFTLASDFSFYNTGDHPTWYDTNADVLYNNIDGALYDQVVISENYQNINVDSSVFTSENSPGEFNKADSITLSLPYKASDIINNEMDVYLYITYDQELVKKFESVNGIDTNSTVVGRLATMKDDITSFVVHFSNGN